MGNGKWKMGNRLPLEPQRLGPRQERLFDLRQLLAEDVLNGFDVGPLPAVVVAEVPVEILQQPLGLHVHDEVPGLGVVHPLFAPVEVPLRDQVLQRPQRSGLDRRLKVRQAPVRQPDDRVFADLALLVQAGETLVDLAHKDSMVPFEGICYVSEPVVTLAVEPKKTQDIPLLLDALEKLAREDPNLKVSADKQTGEYLLSGMGELHLEIAIHELKNTFGIDVTVSSPRVVYMESVQKKGVVALAKSPDKQNSFWVQVMPENEEASTSAEVDSGSVLSVDEHRNVLLDCSGKTEQLSEADLEAIIAGFEYACKAGPLCGEPVRHLKVNLVDMQLSQSGEGGSEVMRGISKAVFGSFLSADPILLEPVYKIIISVATELAGESSRILSTRHGKVTLFEQKGLLTVISGFIPVSETFGFSKELRTTTSGRAFWQMFFDHWEKMPQKLALEVISDLRKQKGLVPEVPKPEKFME